MAGRRNNISDRILSLRVCNSLDQMYGKDNRKEVKVTQKMGEYMEEYFCRSKSRTSGGMAECSLVEGSDSDVMGVLSGFIVVDSNSETFKGCIPIKATRTGCLPGYCKLILTSQQHKLRDNLYLLDRLTFDVILESMQGMYISSKLFCRNYIPFNLMPDERGNVVFDINGPAVRNVNVDYVRAFQMQNWPKEAKLWKSRTRANNWPSDILLTRLENEIPCYVVPKGNKMSSAFELEWRISFVELERELIWNLNDTQFKCYICLKTVKRRLSELGILKEITTYHLKNIIFWMCESLPESEWSPRNLVSCVNKCFRKLIACIKDGNLGHYFIPENNLFHDIEFKTGGEVGNEFLKHWTYIKGILLMISEATTLPIPIPMPIVDYSTRFENIWTYCSTYYDPKFADDYVKQFPEASSLLPCVKIIQAVTKWYTTMATMSDEEPKRNAYPGALVESVVNMISEGHHMDFSQSTIHIALVYFMHGLYDKVVDKLETLTLDKSKKVFISCLGEHKFLCFNTGEMFHLTDEANEVNINDLTHRNKIVYQFIAKYNYREILPYPLGLQVYISSTRDSFRYNPVIISFYLLCMSYLKLGHRDKFNETLTRFDNAVRYNTGRKDFYLSLVLLGHCLYWSGNIMSAYNCFVRSIKVNRSVLNAAVYHLVFLLNDLYRKKEML